LTARLVSSNAAANCRSLLPRDLLSPRRRRILYAWTGEMARVITHEVANASRRTAENTLDFIRDRLRRRLSVTGNCQHRVDRRRETPLTCIRERASSIEIG
jgi:hypothetical protein